MVINEVKKLFDGTDDKQDDFGWQEFTLEELNFAPKDILEAVKKIESKVGLFNWRTKDLHTKNIKVLVYNYELYR